STMSSFLSIDRPAFSASVLDQCGLIVHEPLPDVSPLGATSRQPTPQTDLARLRVQHISQPVPNEVESQDCQHNGQPRENAHPGRQLQKCTTLIQHGTP